MYQRISYFFTNRFIVLICFIMGFAISNYAIYHYPFPSLETKDLWFYSGVFMLLLSVLFIEPYFTSPKNIITNILPILLVFIVISRNVKNIWIFYSSLIYLVGLLLLCIIAISLANKQKSSIDRANLWSERIKNKVVFYGQSKILYSAIFIYFLFKYYPVYKEYTLIQLTFWAIIINIDNKKIHNDFLHKRKEKSSEQLGEIIGVQAKNIFLAKLFDDKNNVNKFDVVEFCYCMQETNTKVFQGIIFDTYLLDQEKWAKVLQLNEENKGGNKYEKNIIYKISDSDKLNEIEKKIKIDNFVGVVIEGSDIGKIKFEYSKKEDDIQEGDILELEINKKRIFYQIINGNTWIENLGGQNQTGFINAEAIQLGEWQADKYSFQKYGWLPNISTPLFKADTNDILVPVLNDPLWEIGKIPGTNLPAVIDLDDAISHHIALLGVTGSGKSYFARKIIDKIKGNTKIICIDFNREFVTTLNPAPVNIIDPKIAANISAEINKLEVENSKFLNQRVSGVIEGCIASIKNLFKDEIVNFLEDTNSDVKILELPDMDNSSGILEYIKYFFKVVFEIAKERISIGQQNKICIVLEEAHTIIPEWNFLGGNEKTSQGVVNSIGQIALQGRKYGVGFIVIAQRTANVSKTVLTQCNTIISFQAFDETSYAFLSNYLGKEMIQILPNLKQYNAVLAGKASKSNIPMIVDLTESEPCSNQNAVEYEITSSETEEEYENISEDIN